MGGEYPGRILPGCKVNKCVLYYIVNYVSKHHYGELPVTIESQVM